MSSEIQRLTSSEDKVSLGSMADVDETRKTALVVLYDATCCAPEFGLAVEDFALELADLRARGITYHDLRWLICAGYVVHLHEQTPSRGLRRRVRPSNSLAFSERSCFLLTAEGEKFASHVQGNLSRPAPPGQRTATADRRVLREATPRWDASRRELRVRSLVVKRFKTPAANQEAILTVFEEEGWPIRIDDPLRRQSDLDPKRRLHDVIKCLNRNQVNRLIRFHGDGTGEGVGWELTGDGLS